MKKRRWYTEITCDLCGGHIWGWDGDCKCDKCGKDVCEACSYGITYYNIDTDETYQKRFCKEHLPGIEGTG